MSIRLIWEEQFLTLLSNHNLTESNFRSKFADDNINVIQKLKFMLGKIETILAKEENGGSQKARLHFVRSRYPTLSVPSTGILHTEFEEKYAEMPFSLGITPMNFHKVFKSLS